MNGQLRHAATKLRQARRTTVILTTAVAVTGCATRPERLVGNLYGASDAEVCQAAAEASEWQLQSHRVAVYEEYGRRELSSARCESILAERSQNRAVAGIAILAGALLVAAARRGGGASQSTASQPLAQQSGPTVDYEWEWDQFYNQASQPIWACRGVQTGQFANEQRCFGKAKIDWKWPGLVFRP